MYSLGETVLPVCPTCVEYGYQPASTTARVAPTAPPSAAASSSIIVKPSGDPSPRPPATMMSASSIDGPLDSSCVCSTSVASVEWSENDGLERLDLRAPIRLDRIERPCADHPELRAALPTDVRDDGVAQRRPRTDELAVLHGQIREVPVEPCIEPRGESGRDVCRQHRRGEQHGVRVHLLDECRESVDPRLRQWGRQLRRLARVHLRRTECAGARGDGRGALAEHDAESVAQRRGLAEHAQAALLERAVVVLEEDERLHRSFLSTTRSRTF